MKQKQKMRWGRVFWLAAILAVAVAALVVPLAVRGEAYAASS